MSDAQLRMRAHGRCRRPEVRTYLVSTESVLTGEQDIVGTRQARAQVVRVEDRGLHQEPRASFVRA